MNLELLCSQPVKGVGSGMGARNELRATSQRSAIRRGNQDWLINIKEWEQGMEFPQIRLDQIEAIESIQKPRLFDQRLVQMSVILAVDQRLMQTSVTLKIPGISLRLPGGDYPERRLQACLSCFELQQFSGLLWVEL